MAEPQSHPSLMSKKAMEATSRTSTNSAPLVHEIFTKVNNAKDKPKKIEVLKQFDSPGLRSLCKAAFDPKIIFDLPKGRPPFIANESPEGTEHTSLINEAKRLYIFIKGASDIAKLRKETLFIQMLESLQVKDAEVLIDIKEKRINNAFKGLTSAVVKEAFNWNDDFLRK
jgi:hypothetical protein